MLKQIIIYKFGRLAMLFTLKRAGNVLKEEGNTMNVGVIILYKGFSIQRI